MSAVDHPSHYGGEENPYEVIKVLRAWDLQLAKGFCWGNIIKYTARAGKKDSTLEDREKAAWYADELLSIEAEIALQEPEEPASESLWPTSPAPQFVEGSGTSIQPEGTIDAWLDGRPYRIYDDMNGVWIKPIGSDRWFKVKP